MREIKFRAWEKNLKEIIPVHEINFENRMINTKSVWRLFDEIELMQYTGLKNKNGKEIYEGDIVKYKPMFGNGNYITAVVEYSEHAEWCLGWQPLHGVVHKCEVIGNIYENPDLLEGVG
ncbi:YopX family protein [Neobacillus sp. NPDC093127]|uniref:YopX family protein n=1 Tax=Neobacillus sp. NPDC093127 TaxID=3364296 RepID=UPI0037FF478F